MPEGQRDEIAKLEALYSENPEGRVFTLLAEAYRKAGELDRAREVLDGGLKRHAQYASAYVVLGRVLTDQKNGPEAESAFRRVLELDPENLVALRALGDLARNAGRTADAVKYYRDLLMLDPSDEDLQELVAGLEREAGSAAAATSAPEPAAPSSPEWSTPSAEPEFGTISIDSNPTFDSGASFDSSTTFDSTPAFDTEPGQSFSLESIDFGGGAESSEADFGSLSLDAPGGDFGSTGFETGSDDFGSLSIDAGPISLDAGDELGGDFGSISLEPAAEDADLSGGFEDLPLMDLGSGPIEDAAVDAGSLPLVVDPVPPAEPELEEPIRPDTDASEPFLPLAPVEDEAESGDDPFAAIPAEHEPMAFEQDGPQTEGEVATETMADLYRSQGLHEKAAEVYRTLLEQRPDDERLYALLLQAETAAAAARPAPEPSFEPEAAFEEAAEETEPDSAWTAANTAGVGENHAFAWSGDASEPGEEADGGPRIAEYFASLLGWKPTRPVRRAAPPAPAAPPPVLEPEPLLDEEPVTVDDLDFMQPEPLEDVVAEEPSWLPEPELGTVPFEAQQEAAQAEEDVDLSWLDDGPAAAPAPAAPAPPPPSPAAPVASAPVEDDLAWLFSDEPAAPAAPAPQASTESPAQAPETPDDDDDLEMFRDWLQSLKK